jgi:type IV secretory pathway TrbD component
MIKEIPINQALTQQILLFGAERKPMIILIIADLVLMYLVMGISIRSVAIFFILMGAGVFSLRKIAEYDPMFFEILKRRYFPVVTPLNLQANPSHMKKPRFSEK